MLDESVCRRSEYPYPVCDRLDLHRDVAGEFADGALALAAGLVVAGTSMLAADAAFCDASVGTGPFSSTPYSSPPSSSLSWAPSITEDNCLFIDIAKQRSSVTVFDLAAVRSEP